MKPGRATEVFFLLLDLFIYLFIYSVAGMFPRKRQRKRFVAVASVRLVKGR